MKRIIVDHVEPYYDKRSGLLVGSGIIVHAHMEQEISEGVCLKDQVMQYRIPSEVLYDVAVAMREVLLKLEGDEE